MKVVPSNQTLILASERGPPASALPHALPIAAGRETVLKRLTLVASRPDATLLYVQADYSSTAEAAGLRSESSLSTAAAETASSATSAGVPAHLAPPAPGATAHRSTRGADLYASTQRMRTEASKPHIDVHA